MRGRYGRGRVGAGVGSWLPMAEGGKGEGEEFLDFGGIEGGISGAGVSGEVVYGCGLDRAMEVGLGGGDDLADFEAGEAF